MKPLFGKDIFKKTGNRDEECHEDTKNKNHNEYLNSTEDTHEKTKKESGWRKNWDTFRTVVTESATLVKKGAGAAIAVIGVMIAYFNMRKAQKAAA